MSALNAIWHEVGAAASRFVPKSAACIAVVLGFVSAAGASFTASVITLNDPTSQASAHFGYAMASQTSWWALPIKIRISLAVSDRRRGAKA